MDYINYLLQNEYLMFFIILIVTVFVIGISYVILRKITYKIGGKKKNSSP